MSACLGAVLHAWYESRLRARAHDVVHNVVAHPLLVLWPRVGRWLHDRTDPAPAAHLRRLPEPRDHDLAEYARVTRWGPSA